ncbi:MAG TPA: PAS domain S-box protein, partial [candidate division WWE3 bacterium]|nr:PAS domain S-box protein [candidate division WWE3 bacterium]
KGAVSLSSRKSGHFSGSLEKDLKSLFELCSMYFTLLADVAQKERRKFKSMIDSMRDAVFMVDEDYKFLIANPAIKEMLGLHEAETVNIVRVSSFFSTRLSIEDVISEVFALGKIKVVDDLPINDRYYFLTAIPVKVRESVVGVVCLIQDQTSEKELEKMRRDFSAMIIHELRSPLSVIRGTSDFLMKESKSLDEPQKESFLSQIKDSSDRLLKLVNDLLDSAKIESGNVELFKSEVDVNALVTEVVDYYAKSADQKKIRLLANVDKSLLPMQADSDKIRQVLNNLISNGLKYTEEGGEVVVSTKKEDGSMRILISDTGRGIEESHKDLIFQKYKQVEYAKNTEKSTGLGLAISKGIVEAHDGKIWVEENLPKGSVFIVELPL